MPTYVVLISWSDQGAKGFKDTVDRFQSARDAGAEAGVTLERGSLDVRAGRMTLSPRSMHRTTRP
jgi:uncharacterized protein with GYD domain